MERGNGILFWEVISATHTGIHWQHFIVQSSNTLNSPGPLGSILLSDRPEGRRSNREKEKNIALREDASLESNERNLTLSPHSCSAHFLAIVKRGQFALF